MTSTAGPVVELRVWGVDRVATALGRMATGRRALARTPGVRFAKLLGTASGDSFTLAGADARHWAALTVWEDDAAARAGKDAHAVRQWRSASSEELRISMRPIRSRGTWSGVDPFTDVDSHGSATSWPGPVAALTRARLRPTRMLSFWRAVPPVAAALGHADGVRLALGVGEFPIGVQGTFSVWDSADALADFAYRTTAHRGAIRDTTQRRWYAEEMFTRLAVTGVEGTYRGRPA
ncbi:hypothetical protein [Gordonia soli]|uniref:Putative monooxygenase n=1 Tax=Gordonia soli NBRC 108243 TaxID=1223545 RepID=M0QEE6_9ACTN|nr:hypothetical protein [Gordonia soli]GAC66963.1 putative monooxygenase [Gordonia soli NBRC 108243]